MIDQRDVPDAARRNHTLTYQRRLFRRIPARARTAIDVGCGEGIAARELAARGMAVVALDVDEPSIRRARAQSTTGIDYRVGDVMTARLEPADVVYAGAVVHHLDLEPGLERLRDLVAPSGKLLVVGLAAASMPVDAPRELAAALVRAVSRLRGTTWEHGAPTVWPPPHSYADVAHAAARILPESTYRRRLMWRYTIEWDRPATG